VKNLRSPLIEVEDSWEAANDWFCHQADWLETERGQSLLESGVRAETMMTVRSFLRSIGSLRQKPLPALAKLDMERVMVLTSAGIEKSYQKNLRRRAKWQK
jgi:hypothetical protein